MKIRNPTFDTRNRFKIHTVALALFLLPLGMTPPAWADLPKGDAEQLAALADEGFATRRAAFRAIANDQDMTPERIEAMYARATTPEQRHRLLDLAIHHMLRQVIRDQFPGGTEGSLGFRLSPMAVTPDSRQSAIIVLHTLPGLPAFGHLEPGDLIVSIGGRPMPPVNTLEAVSAHFMERIRHHRPGDLVELGLLRQGQPVEVRFPVAPREPLTELFEERVRGLESSSSLKADYRERWRVLRERLRRLEPAEKPLVPVAETPAVR